ncbi:hypothetical protein H8E88_24100 [candidate division KSB1 bacterium]|nr:hypothetical protein [candidate division KSB1 bacterium]
MNINKNKSILFFIKIILSLTIVLNAVHGQENIPAFPGAEGFGTETAGGRGGQVIEVTNLNDSGPGSLREAIETDGPRIVVFRVGGMIELNSPIIITKPYITIAGQTAPGDGITVKGSGQNCIDGTHDVIIRYLRFRGVISGNSDCLNMRYGTYNVVIDHCSFSWATDETISVVAKSHDVTIQWCVIAEGLLSHSMGSLVSTGAYNVSIHHCLYAHNSERNAKMVGVPDDLDGHFAYFDFVNNVIYNWGAYAHSVAGSGKGNVIANYFKAGINSGTYPQRREIIRQQFKTGRQIYASGNYGPTCPNGCENDWDGETFTWNGDEYEGGMISDLSGNNIASGYGTRSDTLIPVPQVTTFSASKALDEVLKNSGVIFPTRDAVDERVINDVKNNTGNIINNPSEVGGWPELAPGTAPADSDHDGMPDAWEETRGLDANDPSDALLDADGDGYTNVEDYLNGLVAIDLLPPNSPENLGLESTTDTTIFFTWTAPGPASDGDLAVSYGIKRDNVTIGTTTKTQFTDSGLTKNTTYNYKVYSYDDSGNMNNLPAAADFATSGDMIPPSVTSVRALSLNTLEVMFSEAVEIESAENINNYSINNGISINQAYLDNDAKTVHLSTTTHADGETYILTINNVVDIAPMQNMIAANTTVSYTAVDNFLIFISVDNEYELYINGIKIGESDTWWESESYVFPSVFEKIVIAVKGINVGGDAGLVAYIEGAGREFVSNETWKVTNTLQPFWETIDFADDSWSYATSYGVYGAIDALPWANTPNGGIAAGLPINKGVEWIWTDDNENNEIAYFRYVIALKDITPPKPPKGITVIRQDFLIK